MSVDGLIFDFDGVLLESEYAGNKQIADYLTGIGHPTTPEESMANFMGLSGRDFLAAAETHGGAVMARVPTSSGLLEDKYTLDTTFGPTDHRRHRPRQWLVDGLRKIDQLRFLVIEGERTMAQAALRFILQQPRMACVIPTITSVDELEEFAGAASAPDLTPDELRRVDELYRSGFGLAAAATSAAASSG